MQGCQSQHWVLRMSPPSARAWSLSHWRSTTPPTAARTPSRPSRKGSSPAFRGIRSLRACNLPAILGLRTASRLVYMLTARVAVRNNTYTDTRKRLCGAALRQSDPRGAAIIVARRPPYGRWHGRSRTLVRVGKWSLHGAIRRGGFARATHVRLLWSPASSRRVVPLRSRQRRASSASAVRRTAVKSVRIRRISCRFGTQASVWDTRRRGSE